jgi:GT2 family glycosyltransferase
MSNISVVIVSRNRKDSLRHSLELLGVVNDVSEHQVIVVDNGSSDSSTELEEYFPGARFDGLPKNFGLTKALNVGIRAADRDYVLFLHDDARIAAEGVSQLAAVLEANPDVAAVCPVFPGTPQVSRLPSPAHPYPEWHTATGDCDQDVECASAAAIMVRGQFLKAMRRIDERYGNYGSGLDLCAQVIRRAGKKIRIVSSVKALHDRAGEETSLIAADRAIGTIVFLGKYYGFGAGLKYRISSSLQAIFTFRWGMAKHLLSNQKIDGTQP